MEKNYDNIITKECSGCRKEFKIGLKDKIMPYNETEYGNCPCGYQNRFKSRYIVVDFIFDKER